MVKGEFYNELVLRRDDSPELQKAMEECVGQLLALDTDQAKPGMLLGKVQSGKTRAFIGIIALAFDNGYDLALILTKGTKALTEQTLSRLYDAKELGPFYDDGRIEIHDIMALPTNLNPYELKKKLVLVAKKQTDNGQLSAVPSWAVVSMSDLPIRVGWRCRKPLPR